MNQVSHSHKTPDGEDDNIRFNSPSRGRRSILYRVPSLAHLQTACGVADEALGSCDPVSPEDLRSEKAYRVALHRALIERCAPELSYAWHARRLSVTPRTIARYNNTLRVRVTRVIGYEPLTWAHITSAQHWTATQAKSLGRTRTPGRWLQTPEGNRYPAICGLATALLPKVPLILCRQMPSRFELPTLESHGIQDICIWRQNDGMAPDWEGGPYDDPVGQRHRSEDQSAVENPSSTALTVYIHSVNERPDNLSLIKGLGAWRAGRLNSIGITKYAHLSVADPARLARVSQMGKAMTIGQAEFWVAQAQAVMAGRVLVEDLKAWSYSDWRIYRFELGRISGASADLKQRLAAEFRAKGWLRYGDDLPADFLQLIPSPLF